MTDQATERISISQRKKDGRLTVEEAGIENPLDEGGVTEANTYQTITKALRVAQALNHGVDVEVQDDGSIKLPSDFDLQPAIYDEQ